MKILPKGYRVYVVLDRVEEGQSSGGVYLPGKHSEASGGVYLPGKHSEESRIGTIKAIGEDVEDYKVGDRVLVQFYAGIAIHLVKEDILDDTHRIFNASNILSVVEE